MFLFSIYGCFNALLRQEFPCLYGEKSVFCNCFTEKEDRKYIISSGGEAADGAGFSFYNFQNSYRLLVATLNQTWELQLGAISYHWIHISFTWNKILGLRYYENGNPVANSTLAQDVDKGKVDRHTHLTIGKAASATASVHENLQMYGLTVWYGFISKEQVVDNMQRGN